MDDNSEPQARELLGETSNPNCCLAAFFGREAGFWQTSIVRTLILGAPTHPHSMGGWGLGGKLLGSNLVKSALRIGGS